MKSLVARSSQVIVLAVMSLALFICGSLRPPASAEANLISVPEDSLDTGQSASIRSLLSNNFWPKPLFSHLTLFEPSLTSQPPAITIEVPADPKGRKFIGPEEGVIITVRAQGTDPVTVVLGQRPAGSGTPGVVFYGETGTNTTATVTTSGGPSNVAQIRARGDAKRPSGSQNDLLLTASVGGTEVATVQVTVLRIALSLSSFTLFTDMPVTGQAITEPAIEGVEIRFKFTRQTMIETFLSVNIISLDGPPSKTTTLRTGADGIARFQTQAFLAAQGQTWGFLTIPVSVAGGDEGQQMGAFEKVVDDPKCGDQKKKKSPGKQKAGGNSVALYSGGKALRITDLSIPGRGFDYQFTRSYRSQTSHLRPVATGDFAVDWAFSYSDDRLIPDGDHIVVFRDSLRTDMFDATSEPGVFLAPMEYYDQLRINAQQDFEIRSEEGMVKTYKGLGDPNIAGRLIRIEDRNGNFMRFIYDRPAGLSKFVLTTVVDTMGRNIFYRYYSESESNVGRRGRLREVEDFRRDNSSTGRKLQFDYDEEGNLISATSPVVQGTPNGNNFPFGKTFRYSYTREADIPANITGIDRERLLHNLLTIEYPNESAVDLDPGNPQTLPTPAGTKREVLTYYTDPKDPDQFDRVSTYRIGGTNGNGVPAGGTISYSYRIVGHSSPDTNDPFMQTTVRDRRGNMTEYLYSTFDTLLRERELTRGFRNLEPEAFVTQSRYNADKELLQELLPEGNTIEYVFNERNPDRFQQGNIVLEVRTPGPRGGDQTALFTETVYEPIYQQPTEVTDSRGVDKSFVPPISDPKPRSQRERYTTRYFFDYQEADPVIILPMLAAELGTTVAEVQRRLAEAGVMLGLGDLNGDGETPPRIGGNVVRKVEPFVVLLAGSNQAAIEGDRLQDIITLYRYNQFGQMTSMVDPEANVHTYAYYPETDPDGDGTPSPPPADGRTLNPSTGGYLRDQVIDTVSNPIRNNRTNPPPTNIRASCCGTVTYDDVGNRTSITDGRGIRTNLFVNELNQVVQTIRAAAVPGVGSGDPPEPMPLVAFAYRENIFYDFNDNVTRREVEDRGNTSNTGGFVDFTTKYDILDNPIEMSEEVSVTQTLVTRFRYDANENRTLEIQPEGNAVSHLYDERDLLFQSTRGALEATKETLGAPPGPYNPRGGEPSTVTFNYDQNRNLIEQVDADDTDGSPANNSVIAGIGDVTTYRYDGFDRRIITIDAVGNRIILNLDPVGNVVKETRLGPIGGPSPTDILGARNVPLSITELQYDELNRMFQEDKVLFISPGVITQRPPNVTEGPLTPGDGKVTTRNEYDRKSRATFRIEDDLDTYRTDYDGADRAIKRIDPERNIVETCYDDNNNIIETRETDVSQVAGVPNEVFLTTNFYDSLNRLQRSVDNLGQTMDYRYDSRNNLVAMADAKGPVTGASITRRCFSAGSLTVNNINNFGNVTINFYDGINRRTREEKILTVSRQGDGVNIGADIFGVKTTTPTPDPSQGGGDGKIMVHSEFDRNSLQISLTDDNGNQTRFSFDNLNRRVTETKGICVPPSLADRCDKPTTVITEYDPDDNVVRLTDENGTVTECTFDAINRRTACQITRAPGVVGTTAVRYEYDGLSRRTLATDNNEPDATDDDSVITFAYDSLSRVIEETQKIGALPARAISSAWTADDLRVGLTYPNGRVIEHTFDGLDRLDTVRDQGAAQLIANYDYIGIGRVAQRLYSINGTRLTYLNDDSTADVGYDGVRRPVQLRHMRADNSLVVGFTHTYDRMNNKLTEEKLHNQPNSERYNYDSAYRLTTFNRELGGIRPLHREWTLDGVGNWRRVENAETETRQHSSFNEIIERRRDSSVTVVLSDDNGNVTDDGALLFQWDYMNRLRTVTRRGESDPFAVYIYDATNRRIRKVVDGTTDFYYDYWRVIEERGNADALVQQYVYGVYIDEPLILDRNLDGDDNATGPGDQRLFYHQNTLYSVFALTDTSGAIVEGYQYDAYGKAIVFTGPGPDGIWFTSDEPQAAFSAINNPYTYTGQRFDAETGLMYYKNRYYSTDLGRFITRDPLGYVDGTNLYEYARGNAINIADFTGLQTTKETASTCMGECCCCAEDLELGNVKRLPGLAGHEFWIKAHYRYTKPNPNILKRRHCKFEWWEYTNSPPPDLAKIGMQPNEWTDVVSLTDKARVVDKYFRNWVDAKKQSECDDKKKFFLQRDAPVFAPFQPRAGLTRILHFAIRLKSGEGCQNVCAKESVTKYATQVVVYPLHTTTTTFTEGPSKIPENVLDELPD